MDRQFLVIVKQRRVSGFVASGSPLLLQFIAQCETAGMRISISKPEAMVLSWKRVECSFQVTKELLLRYLREMDRWIGVASGVVQSAATASCLGYCKDEAVQISA